MRRSVASARTRSRGAAAVVLTALLATSACGGDSSSRLSDDEIDAAASELPADVRSLYEAAVAEGSLLMYTGRPNEAVATMAEAFNKTYPGIKIESVQGGGEDSVQRLYAESQAGRVEVDIIEATSPDYYGVLQNDLAVPCEAPNEYEDEELEDPAGLWNVAMMLVDFTAFNTEDLSGDDVPLSFADLTDAKYKGKILTSDSLSPWQALRYGMFDGDLEATKQYFKKLVDNDMQVFTGNPKQTAELMASGQRPIFAWAADADISELRDEGAPVEAAPDEAVVTLYLSGCAKDAPNGAAAKLWMRWLLSEDGQKSQVETGFSSLHPNVESPVDVTTLKKAYFLRPEHAASTDEDLAAYNEIFGLG
jgi:iron(III) transport system substrate-binding protein